jgi:hypothetical protein
MVRSKFVKHIILIITICTTKTSLSQTTRDTVISRRKLDSLETRIYQLTDSLKKAQYKINFLEHFSSADSVVYGKDSVITNYRSKDGKLIKRNTKLFIDSTDLVAYEKIEYFNKLQLPEFVEHWETARWEFNESMFTRKIYSYEPFVYDSAGRKIIWLKFYPAVSRSTVRRIEYDYTSDGIQSTTISRGKLEAFWE